MPVTAASQIVLVRDGSDEPHCNRAGIDVVAMRRVQDRRDVAEGISRAWEAADVCDVRLQEAESRADAAEWWHRYGPIVAASSGVAGAILSAVLTLLGARSVK